MKKLLILWLLLISVASTAQYRTTLREEGNDYVLVPQQAKAVVNWKRFPRFTLNTEWIYWGPRWIRRAGALGQWDDDYLRHGFKSQVPQLNYPGTGNDAENMRDINDLSGSQMMGYILMPGTPAQMPSFLTIPYNALPDGALKTEIGKYINQLIPVTNEAAAKQMGRWMGASIKDNICGGKIPKWVTIDEESARVDLHPQGEAALRTFVGYMYQGILEICTTSKIYTYGPKPGHTPPYPDYAGIRGGSPYFGERPSFLNLWWNGADIDLNNPLHVALKANGGGVAAGDHYFRNTIGNGTIYQRSGGNYLLQNGRRVLRTDNGTATLFGRTFTVYGTDPNYFNNNEYEFYTNWLPEELAGEEINRWWMNGKAYALRKNDRSSDFTGVGLGDWYRTHTEEANAPGAGDSRPCNPQGLEMGAIFRSLLHDVEFLWHGEYLQRGPTNFANQAIQLPGVSTNQGGYNSNLGQYEYIVKGMHRYSEFEGRPWGNFYWVRPNRGIPVTNQDKWKEPSIRGKISETGNHVLIAAAWMIQDNPEPAAGIAGDVTRVDVWVDTGTWKSGSTHFFIRGRDTYLDAWQVPGVPGGTQILPQHLRFRFTNMYGQTFTWTGDYRFTAANSEIMPASL